MIGNSDQLHRAVSDAQRMRYEQALAFWFGRVNYEQRSPQPCDLKLDRMRALLERLGNPHDHFRIVHVAGSKGKGSTSAMLAAILRQAGYRTGLFTSPHLVHVEERIEVDDTPISSEELAGLLEEVGRVVRAMDAQSAAAEAVTFFEIATALGFLYFARRRVEIAVVEVGLGGRFDSTNVCRPLVSIITSISYDHTQLLGNTLARIAMEKAGIVKPGRPTISGARGPEATAVIASICRQRCSPLRQLDVDFHYAHEPGLVSPDEWRPECVRVSTALRHWPALDIGLLGEHQAANAAVAVAAIEELRQQGLSIPDSAVARALSELRWPARLEVMSRRPLVILDCAHNLASAQALVDTLHTSFPHWSKARQRFLIFAGNRDKDLAGMLQLLAPHFTQIFLTRFTNNPRCLPPEEVARLVPPSLACTLCTSSDVAWENARRAAGPDDLIGITGSVFLAGELRPLLVQNGPASVVEA
jgi:dihydrofolate synthase / folylpolyglutamate synthase